MLHHSIEALEQAMNAKGYMLTKHPECYKLARSKTTLLPVAAIKLVTQRPEAPEAPLMGVTPIHYLHLPSYIKGVLKWL